MESFTMNFLSAIWITCNLKTMIYACRKIPTGSHSSTHKTFVTGDQKNPPTISYDLSRFELQLLRCFEWSRSWSGL